MIKAIIFDLGDVCFEVDWIKLSEIMVKKFNINTLVVSSGNKKALEYYTQAQEGKKSMGEMFAELNVGKHDLDEIVSFYKESYKKLKVHNKKGYELIKKLKEKKFIVACLTDTNAIHFEAHKEQGSLDGFDRAFASFQLGSTKKNPETFRKVLTELAVNPEEVIFVDDSDKKLEVAKSLGINVIKYTTYNSLIEDLKKYRVL